MKTLLITTFLVSSFSAFGQKQFNVNDLMQKLQNDKTTESIKNGSYCDLEENQAIKLFSNSNIRKELNIQMREFNFSLFKMYAKQFKIPLSKMVVFNSTDNINTLTELKEAFKGADNPLLCKECYYIPFKFQLTN